MSTFAHFFIIGTVTCLVICLGLGVGWFVTYLISKL